MQMLYKVCPNCDEGRTSAPGRVCCQQCIDTWPGPAEQLIKMEETFVELATLMGLDGDLDENSPPSQ